VVGALLLIVAAIDPPRLRAETPVAYSEEDLKVSYIYSAVMGSGTYVVDGRRITMFRLPFTWTQRKATEDGHGWKWLLPVVVGYDDLGNVDSDWIEALRPEQLVVMSFLPGIEYVRPVGDRWQIKPFLQTGAGRDFNTDETILMTQLGLRTLALYKPAEGWELRWGNGLRWAGERQINAGIDLGFGVFETGLDLRRNTPFPVFGSGADWGAYYVFQRFMPRWTAAKAPDLNQKATSLHEFGLSIGLKQPRKIMGIPLQRFRLGYKWGDQLSGWSIGTDFPF